MHHSCFQDLIDWSLSNYCLLPWRIQRTLYSTLVSEMMLQQTTVATVEKKFVEFMTLFPTLEHLAQATQTEVMSVWRGLGYYQRAKRLHAIAQKTHTLKAFEESLYSSEKYPGIGTYTAAALWAIGLNKPALAIDANIRRVLTRYCGAGSTDQALQAFYHKELTLCSPRALNEALMDLGRTVCTAKNTLCHACPLQAGCATQGVLVESTQSLKIQKKDITLTRFISHQNGQFWGYLKQEGTWLSGYLELPTLILNESEFAQYSAIQEKMLPNESLFEFKSTITHYRIHNKVYEVDELNVLPSHFAELLLYPHDHPLWANTSQKILMKYQQMIQENRLIEL